MVAAAAAAAAAEVGDRAGSGGPCSFPLAHAGAPTRKIKRASGPTSACQPFPRQPNWKGAYTAQGRLSPGSPRGYDGTSEISTATGSGKGHTLSTTAHPLFTGPLLDARKDQHSAQLEHLLALNTSRPPNPTTVPGPLKKSPFALFLKQALRPWQPE